jgi:hypothetical protein
VADVEVEPTSPAREHLTVYLEPNVASVYDLDVNTTREGHNKFFSFMARPPSEVMEMSTPSTTQIQPHHTNLASTPYLFRHHLDASVSHVAQKRAQLKFGPYFKSTPC